MLRNEWFWGIAGTIIGGLTISTIGGIASFFRHRWLDKVRLEFKLSNNSESIVLDKVGCPCMELMIKSVGLRSARIKEATLCLEDKKDFISRFKQGFDGLECSPIEGEPQTLIYKFYGFSKPNSKDGYILDRDDICRFILPICVPCIQLFIDAESEKVTIRLLHFDDNEETILKGLIIQNKIRMILQIADRSKEHYEAKFAKINVSTVEYKPPDISYRNVVNAKEVRFDNL